MFEPTGNATASIVVEIARPFESAVKMCRKHELERQFVSDGFSVQITETAFVCGLIYEDWSDRRFNFRQVNATLNLLNDLSGLVKD